MLNDEVTKWGQFVKPEVYKLMKTLRLDVYYHRARGDYMYYNDEQGREIKVLDLAGGFGATILGHNPPEIKQAKMDCLTQDIVSHAQGSLRELSGELAQDLNDLYPGNEKRIVILTNSGTETVEAALKHVEFNRVQQLMALGRRIHRNCNRIREYFRLHSSAPLPEGYRPGDIENLMADVLSQIPMLQKLNPTIISTERSFHGKSTASLRVTGNAAYSDAFALLSGIDVKFVKFNDLDSLRIALRDSYRSVRLLGVEDGRIVFRDERFLNAAAFIMEPVQGEGGIHVAEPRYMKGIEALRRRHGFEWILDEIQSGMGRTGRVFAMEHYPIKPDSVDYILLSKALGGSVSKIGAMMVRESIHDPRFGILHTSTFAEDDESALVALKTLSLLSDDNSRLLRAVREKGRYLRRRLKDLKKKYPEVIKDVRGLGLMIGVEFSIIYDQASLFFSRSSQQGVLGTMLTGYLFHEHNIRSAPPLNALVNNSPYNVMRIEPSANITIEELDRVVAAIDRACEIIAKRNAYCFSRFIVGRAKPGDKSKIKNYKTVQEKTKPDPAFKNARRMAFLIHPLDVNQVMEDFDPSFQEFSKDKDPETGLNERQIYWDTIVPLMESFVYRDVNVKSPRTGDRVNAKFIAFLYTTRQMNILRKTEPDLLVDGVQKAVDLGACLGADICGLGAFTSIITHNGTDLDDAYIRVTSGNSYTTALIWQSILKAADYMSLDLNKSVGAVVGAGGNIGSVTAALLSEDVPKIYLVGSGRRGAGENLRETAESIYSDSVDIIRATRPEQLKGLPAALAADMMLPLAELNGRQYRFHPDAIDDYIKEKFKGKDKKIANLLKSVFYRRPDEDIGKKMYEAVKLKHGSDPFLVETMNIQTAVGEADVVVSAVSAHTHILDTAWIKPGAIVNDVSLPPSISLELYKDRPDVLAIQGGIGHLPEYLDLGIPGLAVGATLGCMAETFILTMMNMIDNYSYGRISKQQVIKIWEAGRILGFGLAAIKYKDQKLTRDIAAEIKSK